MKKEILISVIIPNYNNAKYIGKALDSVLNQQGGFNTEIIIVDDASTDNSVDVIQEYKKKYKNIKLFINKTNSGQSISRNIGMKHITGKYVLFLDGDDFLSLDTFKICMDYFKKYKIDMVAFDMMAFFPNGDNFPCWGNAVFNKEKVLDTKKDYIPWILSNTAPNMFLTKSLDGIKFEEGKIFEDWIFNYCLFARGIKIKTYNEKPLYYYRRDFTVTTTVGVGLGKHIGLFYAYNTAADTILDSGCYNVASVVNDTKILYEALGVLRQTKDKNYDNIKLFVSELENYFKKLPETYQKYLLSCISAQDRIFMKKSTVGKLIAITTGYDRWSRYKYKIQELLRNLFSPAKWLIHYLLTIYKLCVMFIKVIVYFIRVVKAYIKTR